MKEQFVTFAIAQKLKELGFNEPCMAMYYLKPGAGKKTGFERVDGEEFADNTNHDLIAAPLWQQAIDWLMKEHNICIAEVGKSKDPTFELFINQKHVTGFEADTRKAALLAAIKKAILFVEETIENAK